MSDRQADDLREYQLHLGETLRDEGERRAAASDPVLVARAEAILRRYVRWSEEFTAEDLRLEAGEPASANAVGGVIARFARRGEIVCVGYRRATRLQRHGGIQRIWRGIAS